MVTFGRILKSPEGATYTNDGFSPSNMKRKTKKAGLLYSPALIKNQKNQFASPLICKVLLIIFPVLSTTRLWHL
jgi:hypothetical protein